MHIRQNVAHFLSLILPFLCKKVKYVKVKYKLVFVLDSLRRKSFWRVPAPVTSFDNIRRLDYRLKPLGGIKGILTFSPKHILLLNIWTISGWSFKPVKQFENPIKYGP